MDILENPLRRRRIRKDFLKVCCTKIKYLAVMSGVSIVRTGEKEHHFYRFDEQQPHGRGRGKKLYRSF